MARIDCAAFFRKVDSEREYEPHDIEEFILREAVPLLIPYIRETLADISRRVTGRTLTFGLIQPGDLSLDSAG